MAKPYLCNPKKTVEVLQRYHFTFQKRYGQNFLIDDHAVAKILDAAKISNEDFILEIGPGIGTLTQYLAEAARKVIAVEVDKGLMPILEDTLMEWKNVEVLNQDILDLDIHALIEKYNEGKPFKVIANLPYYITTPIILSLFEKKVPLSSAVVMIQKEVADRMQAQPGTKDYGALSLAVQYYSAPKVVANVPPNCFMPRPKVSSSVICMQRYDRPPVSVQNENQMFRLIHLAFGQRRKMLVNALSNSKEEIGISKEMLADLLQKMGLRPDVRGEALSLEQFAGLSDMISESLSATGPGSA